MGSRIGPILKSRKVRDSVLMEPRFQWHGKRRDPGAGVLLRPCSDCQGLKDGTRSDQDPHEYLLFVGPLDSHAGSDVYRCLLCDSTLTRERAGAVSRWS